MRGPTAHAVRPPRPSPAASRSGTARGPRARRSGPCRGGSRAVESAGPCRRRSSVEIGWAADRAVRVREWLRGDRPGPSSTGPRRLPTGHARPGVLPLGGPPSSPGRAGPPSRDRSSTAPGPCVLRRVPRAGTRRASWTRSAAHPGARPRAWPRSWARAASSGRGTSLPWPQPARAALHAAAWASPSRWLSAGLGST